MGGSWANFIFPPQVVKGNVGKTAYISLLTLFESRYRLNNQPVKVIVH